MGSSPYLRRRIAVLLAFGLLVVVAIAAEVSGGSSAGDVSLSPRALFGPFKAGVFPHTGPRASARQARAIERVRWRLPYVSAGSRRGKLVALTFDDGPGPYTWRVVRTLRRLHAPATFFQVGQMVAAWPRAARLVRRHFPVGDHTESHPQLARMRWVAQRRQIASDAARIRDAGSPRPLLFRPPYASFDARTLGVLRGQRMLMVLWDVDSADWTRPGVRGIVRNVLSRVRAGSIVLMHDAGGDRSQTMAALPFIVRGLRRRGFRLVTVPRMMLQAPPRGRQRVPPGAQYGRRRH